MAGDGRDRAWVRAVGDGRQCRGLAWGFDVIAVLALAGAVAVRELLAAAVIAVMLASGRALEARAAERAQRDLHALLARAPRTARRYCGTSLETVPITEIAPGDLLMVAPGDSAC